MKKTLLYIFILFQAYNICAQNDSVEYSFFTAGHTYGNPNSPHYGLHYPFVDFIPEINNYPLMSLGFLTGDVVVSGTPEYWDSAQIDINKLNIPIYLAAGNHDIGSEFVNRFGEYYFSFNFNNDLFIVLTPGLDSWNISGQQLTFLENTLDSSYANVNNIFIFIHELIWWSPTNEYQYIDINYEPAYPGSSNFDLVVKPLLLSYPNNITIYAGDLGCTNNVSPFMYDHFENITLIGSGMGGGIRDNIIITNVYNNSIYYDLIAINDTNQNALGEIYDYSVNTINETYQNKKIVIYPNPSMGGYFNVQNEFRDNFNMRIFDMQGNQIYSGSIQNNSVSKIETTNIKSGIYFIQFFNENQWIEKKVIIFK